MTTRTTAIDTSHRDHLHIHRSGGPQFTLGSVLSRLLFWSERARQRRHLADLTTTQLADIGVSRKAVLAEAGKPFWQA